MFTCIVCIYLFHLKKNNFYFTHFCKVIKDIAAGHGHSLVLSDKGQIFSFGSGVFGQLGTGNTTKSSVPVLVQGISEKIILIATGYFHSVRKTSAFEKVYKISFTTIANFNFFYK